MTIYEPPPLYVSAFFPLTCRRKSAAPRLCTSSHSSFVPLAFMLAKPSILIVCKVLFITPTVIFSPRFGRYIWILFYFLILLCLVCDSCSFLQVAFCRDTDKTGIFLSFFLFQRAGKKAGKAGR
ncbi:hypothetical protein BZA77DRAFT_49374 [Pyronema omphalodes]|nr:hypothetical protein BZA77DRAFT_49374 [Pyronema omphalodes]